MNKRQKIVKRILLIVGAGILLGLSGFLFQHGFNFPSKSAAEKRARAFAEEINHHYSKPEGIYSFLTQDYRKTITEKEFVEAFLKERSYPYLTPLWINFKRIEMAEDNLSGTAYYDQAARLKGMVYEVPFVYENFNYYMIDFEEFPDGSYLEKFDHIPNYLNNGWD